MIARPTATRAGLLRGPVHARAARTRNSTRLPRTVLAYPARGWAGRFARISARRVRYSVLSSSSRSCVPSATSRPSSIKRIRFASRTVSGRWAGVTTSKDWPPMAFRPVPPTCQPRPKGEDGLVTLARDDLVFQFHVEVIESRERRLPVGVEVNQGAAVPQLASVAGCVTSTQRTRSDSSASLLEAQVTVRLATTRTIPTVAVALVSLFMTLPFFNPLCLNA